MPTELDGITALYRELVASRNVLGDPVYLARLQMAACPGLAWAEAQAQCSWLNGWGTPVTLALGTVSGDGLNVRQGPGTSYPSLGKLNTGAAVEIWRALNGWLFVASDDASLQGWVSEQYVQRS
jgi:hypothetical protein